MLIWFDEMNSCVFLNMFKFIGPLARCSWSLWDKRGDQPSPGKISTWCLCHCEGIHFFHTNSTTAFACPNRREQTDLSIGHHTQHVPSKVSVSFKLALIVRTYHHPVQTQTHSLVSSSFGLIMPRYDAQPTCVSTSAEGLERPCWYFREVAGGECCLPTGSNLSSGFGKQWATNRGTSRSSMAFTWSCSWDHAPTTARTTPSRFSNPEPKCGLKGSMEKTKSWVMFSYCYFHVCIYLS